MSGSGNQVPIGTSTAAGPDERWSKRSLWISVFLPTFLFALGQGAVNPYIVLTALDLGASPSLAAIAIAAVGVGQLAGDLPAAMIIDRFGERTAVALSSAVMCISLVGCIVVRSPVAFCVLVFFVGMTSAIWFIARLAYLAETVPISHRGRVLSTVGGINRIGTFAGSFIGAAAATFDLRAVYLAKLVVVVISASAFIAAYPKDGPSTTRVAHHDVWSILSVGRANSRVLLTAGLGALSIAMLRSVRQAALPLWADHVGLGPAAVGILFGISTGAEIILFYPAGVVCDRLGRKFIAVPCALLMAIGFLTLPLSKSFPEVAIVAVVFGIGNGIGSGIVQTLGVDFAPRDQAVPFLGAWRLMADTGTSLGPVCFSAFATIITLAGATALTGALGIVAAAAIARFMPETIRRRRTIA